jgi:hypothetical protein
MIANLLQIKILEKAKLARKCSHFETLQWSTGSSERTCHDKWPTSCPSTPRTFIPPHPKK